MVLLYTIMSSRSRCYVARTEHRDLIPGQAANKTLLSLAFGFCDLCKAWSGTRAGHVASGTTIKVARIVRGRTVEGYVIC